MGQTMTFEEFTTTLADDDPPTALAPLLRALWHDRRGNWDEAHRIAQGIEHDSGARVHAYLHRREGDAANAAYWYRRARRDPASGPLDLEWEELVRSMLA